jgi:hypothetical protein
LAPHSRRSGRLAVGRARAWSVWLEAAIIC